jgi:hypothetical protein
MGPCHHGVPRPQIVNGGTASNMKGSCEYIEQEIADNLQGVILQLGSMGEMLTTPNLKMNCVAKQSKSKL